MLIQPSTAYRQLLLSRAFLTLLALQLLACGLFSLVTPIGEGPDEPAHLHYVETLLQKGLVETRAELRNEDSEYGYELHQPPLYYLTAAGWSRWLAADLDYPFVPNPAFPQSKQGGAFLKPPPSDREGAARRGVHQVRWLGLLFGSIIAFCAWRVARESGLEEGAAICVVAPFVLAPQLSFLGGLVSNDGMTFAICAAALWLQRRVHQGDAGPGVCLAAGLLTAAAPWSKVSGFVLLPTLLLAGNKLLRIKAWRGLAALMVPTLISWALCAIYQAPAMEWLRESYAHLGRGLAANPKLLIDYPFWPIQLWISYWAKLTWFQLRLPLPLYLFYLPPSLLVLFGFKLAFQERFRFLASAAIFWAAALLSNLGNFLIFIILVDFQPQGRLLFPSLIAAVGLASLSWKFLERRYAVAQKMVVRLGWISIFGYFLLELAAAAVIIADEGWP